MNSTKKAIVIMPNFFDYPTKIKQSLAKYGYHVEIYYEQPGRIQYLFLKRLSSFFKTLAVYDLFNSTLERTILKNNLENSIDLLLVIRGNILKKDTIEHIQKKLLKENGESIYYSWDSFNHLIHNGDLGLLFDRRYTFDYHDAEIRKNECWQLLPLFFTDDYDVEDQENQNLKYDISCCASFSLERYRLVQTIIHSNPDLNINCKLYLDRKLRFFKSLTERIYRHLDEKIIIYKPLKGIEIAKMLKESRAVLDIVSSGQTGLTMRTIETIGIRRKLITNNQYVSQCDFFNKDNIFIISQEEPYIPKEWLKKEYQRTEKVRTRYSLNSWTKTVLQLPR